MIETIIYILLSVFLVGSTHVWSAIKSGCFYAKGTRNADSPELKLYVRNLHFVQTPFWYSLFGAFALLLFCIWRIKYTDTNLILRGVLIVYLITHGTSVSCGYLYQKYINIGSGKPAIDPNEKRSFEFANPFSKKSIWIPKFWYGKNRVYLSFVGILMIASGIILFIFTK